MCLRTVLWALWRKQHNKEHLIVHIAKTLAREPNGQEKGAIMNVSRTELMSDAALVTGDHNVKVSFHYGI